MELRHLRYFVAVAEELSFTRAAERLHIGQPPLSQQIQALEAEIGATLLDRSHRKVRLTSAGSVFLQEAKRVLTMSADAGEHARRAERGEEGELSIGFTRSVPYAPFFPKLINAYRTNFPEVALRMHEMPTMKQLEAINDRTLDLGFIRPFGIASGDALEFMPVEDDPLYVAMPSSHSLAILPVVEMNDLRHEKLVMFPHDDGTTLHTKILKLCRDADFDPKVAMEVREAPTIIGLVAASCGVSILPSLFSVTGIQGVCFRPLANPGTDTNIVLVSRKAEANQAAIKFRQAALQLIGSEMHTAEQPA
ncbi:LysR family transcriptional regulator [Candidimonas nitroreducens]|uniref:LysR family transcriptional regulator n=1 Tax=Candidimonas nitroreducens TaxID=683354 RepID=A0A225MR56_9BURK|nr:LysR family transcriptional regulator [Candidimonas nitroreducens]